jgi:hypothetical protein
MLSKVLKIINVIGLLAIGFGIPFSELFLNVVYGS